MYSNIHANTNTLEKLNTSSIQLGRYHAVYTHVVTVHLPPLSYSSVKNSIFKSISFSVAPIWLKADIPIFDDRYLPIPIADPSYIL